MAWFLILIAIVLSLGWGSWYIFNLRHKIKDPLYKTDKFISTNYMSNYSNGYTKGYEQEINYLGNGCMVVKFIPFNPTEGVKPSDMQEIVLAPLCREITGKGKDIEIEYYSPHIEDYGNNPEAFYKFQERIRNKIKNSTEVNIMLKQNRNARKLVNDMVKLSELDAHNQILELHKNKEKALVETIKNTRDTTIKSKGK